MSNKQIHYNMDNIESKGATYNLIYRRKEQWEKLSAEAQESSQEISGDWKKIYTS